MQRLRSPNFLARRLLLSCVAEPDFCLDPEATFFFYLIFKAINKTFENKDENMLSRELELMPKGFKKKTGAGVADQEGPAPALLLLV